MRGATGNKLDKLAGKVGAAWNQFWYQPSDPLLCSVLRIAVGCLTLLYLTSYSFDLLRWFGPTSMLPTETAQALSSSASMYLKTSYFYYLQHPTMLWCIHQLGCGVVACWTFGIWSRVTNVVTFIVLLAYLNRVPQLLGPWEMALSMLVFYLCVAPTGQYLSIDACRFGKSAKANTPHDSVLSWQATLAVRLIQVHLCGLYFTMGARMLASEIWWEGSGLAWLLVHSQEKLVDLTLLGSSEYLTTALNYVVVGIPLVFALFVWFRPTRLPTTIIALMMWTGLGIVTGQAGLSAAMIIGSIAFFPPQRLHDWLKIPTSSRVGHGDQP